MQTEADRMTRLIDDLLSLSKIEMSRHKKPKTPQNLQQIVESTLQSMKVIADIRKITFENTIPESTPRVLADYDQIMQVMVNLLSNAAKYAHSETTVIINAEIAQGNKVRISIKDKGPGIDEEHLLRLTERFYRVDNARSRQMGGTGLGLAIVKHILLRHNSHLSIRSTVGEGSTFSFSLRNVE